MTKKRQINIGNTVTLKHPSYSSHRYFTWDTGMVTNFSDDEVECKIKALVKGVEKTFVEYVDNIKRVENVRTN